MAEAILSVPDTETTGASASSPLERRLRNEWRLLQHLQALNPERLADIHAEDCTFYVTLLETPALALPDGVDVLRQHRLRIDFPRYFPAVPMEAFLSVPVKHPNIHPESGFVCLWDTHRVSNTVEHALLKVEAMLGWRLLNLEARHRMQHGCTALEAAAVARALQRCFACGCHSCL